MQTMTNLRVIGDHQENTVEQMRACLACGGASGVLCADGHKGYSQPVGGVIAYVDQVSISGVGFDIGCGNKAARLNVKGADLVGQWSRLADEIGRRVSFGVGRTNPTPVEHPLFDDVAWKMPVLASLNALARAQLGTVGSGNHYVDLFTDEADDVWIGVHFGSRGLGHKVATHFLNEAGGKDGMDVPPCTVNAGTPIFDDYVQAMRLAGEYASAGRDDVVATVAGIVGGAIQEEVHNHHNFAWPEYHGGELLWVVRKGATPAFPGQRGFVGGSMGDMSVILRGVDSPDSAANLYSTVHGAGRVMSRTEAAGKMKWVLDPVLGKKMPKRVTAGRFDDGEMRRDIAGRGIELRGAGPDESPGVYRPLASVLAHHEGTVEIEHRLSPRVVVMAGAGEFDPYKD